MQMSINTNRSNKPFGTEFRLVRPGCFHLIIFLFAFSPLAQAQIGGANPSTVGETEKYVYYSSPVYSTFQWENAGGTPVNFGYDNVNYYYWVDISWQATGEHYLMFIGDGNIISQTTITVVACTPPAAPPQPTYSTNVCGPKTLYFNGAPGTGVTWYWQGENANGTSMANSSSSTEVSLPGTHTYYLRTRSANCWGGSVAVSVTVNVIPHEPWPVIREPINYTCGAKELDAEPDDGPPPTGEMWYWQGNSEFGTEINHIYTIPYQAYQSDTYYIRARSEAGCWSETSMSYTTTVNNPSQPAKPTRFTTETCGPQSIGYTASEVPPNTTWYWQISSTPTQGFGSESSMDLIESGTYSYYLRARSGSCWSTLSPQLSVLVDNPHTPWPVIREPSDYTCGVKELTAVPDDGPPPNGVSWYWQGLEEEGMNEAHDYSIPYQAYQSGNYYIRAKSDGGCWSQGSLQWPANVNNPTQPPFPEISPNNCGAKTISYDQPAGSDDVWYWQTEASGQDKTNSSSSILIEEPGYYTYFLRSNRGDCWSPASSQTFNVYISPSTPSPQTLTYCNWENIILDTEGKNANWYDSENTLQYSGEYLTLGKIYDPGTYLFKVEAVGDGNCPSPAKANIEINITDDCNEKLNWIETKTYNLNDLASHSLSFFDQTGSLLQSQTWSLAKNKILVSQPIRDRFGRLVLNTLSAPSAHTVFKYNVKFVWSPDGRPYSYIDFDQLGHLDGTLTPSPVVSDEQGSLGWYYGANNTWEDHVPVTGYPYTRTDFYDDGTGELRKSAGAGEHHRMGSGHEILSGTFPVFSELDDYVVMREKALPGISHDDELILQGVQTVTRDQNGRYAVSITDKSGNLVMTGRQAGDDESLDGAFTITNSVTVDVENPMIYFYLLQPFDVGISGSGSYSVENLVTGLPFTPSDEWPVGFYRVIVSSGSITVAYQNKLPITVG